MKYDDPLTAKIISACYRVHNELGPGFTEKIYLNALKVALEGAGLSHECERTFKVSFKGRGIGTFRVDLVVEGRVIVELKAIERYLPKVFESQVISYLRASGLPVGLLVNFGDRKCTIRRLLFSG